MKRPLLKNRLWTWEHHEFPPIENFFELGRKFSKEYSLYSCNLGGSFEMVCLAKNEKEVKQILKLNKLSALEIKKL